MNKPLNESEIIELETLANWLESTYQRLQGAEIAISAGMFSDKYRDAIQDDLDQLARVGISLGRSMEHVGCLFEMLSSGLASAEYWMRARSEVNSVLLTVQNMVSDCWAELELVDDEEWEAAVNLLTKTQQVVANRIRAARFPVADEDLADCLNEGTMHVQKSVYNHIVKINKRWKAGGVRFFIFRDDKNPTKNSIKRKEPNSSV